MSKIQGRMWSSKGFNITWIQRKKNLEKEGRFHEEEDQEKFRSELRGKKGKASVLAHYLTGTRGQGQKSELGVGVYLVQSLSQRLKLERSPWTTLSQETFNYPFVMHSIFFI